MSKVDEYVAGLSGWQAETVAALRRDILAAGDLTEDFKWAHPMWSAAGAVCLAKAFKGHVTLAFWRGAEMTDLDARLEPSGGFKMASIKITAPGQVTAEEVRKLVAAGVALNREKGDPMKAQK